MSARVIALGAWLRTPSRTAEGTITFQLSPAGSGSSIPSHVSFVDPLRPEVPMSAPIAQLPCWSAESTIRFHAARGSGRYRPAQPGVIRPMSDTRIVAVMTSPAPARARHPGAPMEVSRQAVLRRVLSMGQATTRLGSSSPRNVEA